jgi:hypothetical protein
MTTDASFSDFDFWGSNMTHEFVAMVAGKTRDTRAMGEYLDVLTQEQRLASIRALPRTMQKSLYDAATGYAPLTVSDFVPDSAKPYAPVHHFGINNMPLFRNFAKVMYRLPDGSTAGYNEQPWRWLTGPGYFVVEPSDKVIRGDVVINYHQVPHAAPPGWPAIRDNGRGFSHFVYRGMKDYMRRVSKHVTIGHAVRNGVPQPQCFILVRDVAADAMVKAAHQRDGSATRVA